MVESETNREAQPPQFSIECETEGAVNRVVVGGELDMATAPELESALIALLDADLVDIRLDLVGVSFLDSSGLRVIVRAAQAAESEGGSLRIDGLSPSVERILEVTGLIEQLRGDQPPR